MGNSGSAANSDNEDEETAKEPVEEIEKEYGDSDNGVLDLTVLFDPKQLRVVADKIKEDTAVSPLQQHHTPLTRWLEERRSRGAETVTLMQFVDSVTNKGVSKEIATEIFEQFDVTGDGIVDLDYLHEMLDLSSRSISGFAGVRSDLQAVNKLLQNCIFAPGFIDAFTTGKTVQVNHGQKIFKFLCQNRALSSSMGLPALRGFVTSTDMRMKVLNAHLKALKERADSKKREPALQADEILKPINRCFASAEVSSNRNDASKLIDNDNGTYWQSDGPARSHWVRLTIPPNVVIKQLSMYVVSSDQSYMPHHVVVYGGRDESNLRELNDVRIPNHITGDFTLLENLKVPYQIIQISIKRCHSDGCDTRIRQVKAIGYRVVKSKGVSVIDATSMWYLSVLASTAQSVLPVAPQLRESIIEHTRVSLSHMGPLSLSSSSIERPGFLSNNVMEQMERFLSTIICMDGSPEPEEIVVLLEFGLVRGSLGSILDVLKHVLEKVHVDFPAVPILRSLTETEEKAIRKHGQKLPLIILSCDGGSKDSSSPPSNVLTDNWKTDTYLTATGKTKCNMAFGLKTGNLIQLTRIFMKISKGNIGPKGGLIFVFDSDNIKDESGATLFQPLEEYDNWTENDYNRFKERVRGKHELKPYDPVGYFSVDKDWADVDICVDHIKTGSCVTIKFLGPRQTSAERLGIVGISLYGYEQNEDVVLQQKELEQYQKGLSEDDDDPIPGISLFLQTLHFLQVMCRDAINMKAPSKESVQEKDSTVDIHDVTMEQLWNLHMLISKSSFTTQQSGVAMEMLLNLFHIALPYLRPTAQKVRETRKVLLKGKKIDQDKVEKEANQFSSTVFRSLCDIVDDSSTTRGVHMLAKVIILDGAEVFFPDAQTRRAHLLSLVDKVMEDGKAVSLAYTFESLCRFFSHKDASGLLGLPDYLPQPSFQPESVVYVMKTLVSVAYRECLSQIKDEVSGDVPSNLVLLLCAMQKSLLAWCLVQCDNSENRPIAVDILLQYVEMISEKCDQALLILEASNEKFKIIDRMEYSFVSIAMRQLILFLHMYSTFDLNCVRLLRHLQPFAFTLGRISFALPELFSQGSDFAPVSNHDSTVLREWELESEHDYENNMNFTKVFNCPGCTCFRVVFDSKCQTERRYDYLEFTDSSGCKRRFDQSVGTEKWPDTVTFDGGQRLHFCFHSDGSNTAWGYKFKVLAIGSPDVAMSWIFDLQLNLSRCFGIFCGNALNSKKALGIEKASNEENQEERALLHSELWGSLFRGGYMVGKLERSLSGFHRNNPSDSNVNMFLCSLAHGEGERSKSFLERCKLLFTGQKIGGELLDSAVQAVFSALLWHTQELREIVGSFTDDNPVKDIPTGIINAYHSAESIRRPILERRQRLLVQSEEHSSENAQRPCDPDTPVISCREKALFLLKFAGLSKFMSKKQSTHSLERRSSVLNRAPKVGQESYDQKRNSRSFDEPPEKYPSFQLVLDFVTNESLSHKKIHDLLQHRCKYANTITNVYTYASEYINHMTESENLHIPCILFLQSMLSCQDHFPQHYGDYLNGCGLELENGVRNSFYSFIRKLAGIVATNMNSVSTRSMSPLFSCAQAYLLHFLDVEWKTYDYYFVNELNLQYLLIKGMQGVSVPSEIDEEEAEFKMCERHQQFLKEAKQQNIDAWCTEHREKAPVDIQRDINLFIARYSSDLDVLITCDGCNDQIKGGRRRCLNCIDMDLCSKCFANGVKPNDHTNQHVVIDLRFTCDGCGAFIIETRIHCNECNDFDLCLGCYKNDNYPPCHEKTHLIARSRLIPKGLLPAKTSRGVALQNNNHLHSWLQFCALTLSLSEALQNRKSQGIEQEYVKEAAQLLLGCLEKLVECLSQASIVGITHVEKQHERVTKVKFEDVEKVINISTLSNADSVNQTNQLEPIASTVIANDNIIPASLSSVTDEESVNNPPISSTVTNTDYFAMSTDSFTPTETNQHSELPDLEEEFSNTVTLEQMNQLRTAEHKIENEVSENTETMEDSITKLNLDSSPSDSVDILSSDTLAVPASSSQSDNSLQGDSESTTEINSVSTTEVTNATASAATSSENFITLQFADSTVITTSSSSSFVHQTTDSSLIASSTAGSDTIVLSNTNNDTVEKKSEKENKEKCEKETSDSSNAESLLQEKVITLIGAIIPANRNKTVFPSSVDFAGFVSTQLLPALFSLIRDKSSKIRLRMITLGVLAKVLHCFGPEVADTAILSIMKTKKTEEHISGTITAKYIFNLGAECLKNADLDTASGVESVLKSFWSCRAWKDSIADHAKSMLQELTQEAQNPSLSSLFSLMFLAGFPDIFHIGMMAVIREAGNEPKNVAILSYVPEETTVSVVNFKNRKKMNVKENSVEAVVASQDIHDSERLPLLLEIIKKNITVSKGASSSVERLWVLGLACKALLNMLKSDVDKDDFMKIAESGVLPSIVTLSCQGTGFSKQWLLRDLEVLSWKLYKTGESLTNTKLKEGNDVFETLVVPFNIDDASDDVVKSPLDGLDEETKLCMETIHDALNCPYPILRAIYEHNGKDREKLLEEVQRSFDGTAGCIIRPSEEIRELAKQWEKKEPSFVVDTPIDSSIDVGILKFQPQTVEFKDLQAKPEGGENPNKLISSLTEEEINETMSRQRRMKSTELLKKELDNKQRENPREFAEKVNYAVAVGYSRHLVGWLFAKWKESDGIMSSMLDNIDPQNIVGLLDLIQSLETKEHFQKVVFNFIRCCNKQLVQPLALSAVQCMSEVRLATETRESEHKYKNDAKDEDKVHIPGATSLFIRFDDRCSTEYSCDELVLSSSSNFQQNRRVFSGSTDWEDFEMPGDTVFYKFTSDSSNNDWGWKFTITGGQLGRFETGCGILSALLAQDHQFARRLPLKQLWSWLIVVACNQVGQQRLMATGLLLRILQIAAGDPYLFGGDVEPTPEKCRPNLSLLRPLWTLYTNSIESDSGTSLALISPVLRGLSELFLVVENVAQDWGEADDLVAGLSTEDKLKRCFTKVVKSIAAIGLAINLPNKAIEMLQNAKDLPPLPSVQGSSFKSKKLTSIIQLRITGGDGSDIESDDDMLFDDDTTQDEDDDDESLSDSSSDLSHPEAPPMG